MGTGKGRLIGSGRAMAQGKGQSGTRREPVFDSGFELRVALGDRAAGGGGKPPAKRKRARQPRKMRADVPQADDQ